VNHTFSDAEGTIDSSSVDTNQSASAAPVRIDA
jgi:hypothetical protein